MERIRAALTAAYKYNFTSEQGLINASYPPTKSPILPTFHNIQADAPWTGVEYAIASMMMDYGLVDEGISVVKAINDRYLRAGRIWNHVECGDHYYRAMSSWAILLGATGFKLNVPKLRISFNPISFESEFKAPWFASTAWGSFTQNVDCFELQCSSGTIQFKELVLKMEKTKGQVLIDEIPIEMEIIEQEGYIILRSDKISLSAGQILVFE